MGKKILIIANHCDGLYGFRKELIENFIKSNNSTVTCVIPSGDKLGLLKSLGCDCVITDIDRRGLNPLTDFKLIFNYFRIIKKLKPDLVITYTIKPNIYGGIVSRLTGTQYAINITGLGTAFQSDGFLRKIVVALYKIALKKAKVVFFENSENRQIFIQENIVCKDITCLLNGAGVNLEHFKYCEYPEDADTINFLFVGRIMKEKGVEEIFSAMKRLIREGYRCMLSMIGTYEEDYSETIARYVDEGWLRYLGYQEDVRPFIEQAHCFVLPSYHEGMANTNLECASMGRPIITSNIHGCKEAVRDNISGFLCEPKDDDSLYNEMKKMMELTNYERAQMGRFAREHMVQNFEKQKVVEQTVQECLCEGIKCG